jgi:hypothetical protein
MNLKTTYILFGVLLLVLLVFAATQFSGCDKAGGDKEGYLFADLIDKKSGRPDAKDIDTLRIERPAAKQTIVFTHEKTGWQMTEPYHLRTDNFAVSQVVDQVVGARREQSDISSSLGQYGLDEPRTVVTFKKGDKEWKLNVGNDTGKTGVVYVTTGAKPKDPVAISRSSISSLLDDTLNDFRDKALLTATSANATGVKMVEAKGTALALEKSSEGRWRFEQPAYGPASLDGDSSGLPPLGEKKVTGVRDLIDDATRDLRVEANDDFVAEGVSDADLAGKYGLDKDKPETLRIEMKTKSGDSDRTETLLIGKKAKKEAEKKEGDKKDEKKPADQATEYYFVRLDGEKAVERVPAAKVKPLLDVTANPDALRSRDLVTTGTGKVDALDVQAGGGTFKLREVDNKWTLYRDGARATDADAVRELVEALTGQNPISNKRQPVIKLFLAKDEGFDFDKPAAVVSVWIDGVKKDEKKGAEKKDDKDEKKDDKKDEKKEPELTGDKPAAKLIFGRVDRDKGIAYVKRESGGDTTIVMVSDNLYNQVTGSYLAYLDRSLPTWASSPFDATKDVTKLSLFRNGQPWEVTAEKSGDKTTWKFTQPQAMAGRTANDAAVGRLLTELSSLRADKVVDEKPSDSNLDAVYGLKNPQAKATVTVKKDDKTEDWVYTIGKQDEKKNGVYAMVNKGDLVYLLPSATLDHLVNAELRDLTVFKFDPKQVKGAKVTVWSNDLGGPIVMDLERKGDNDWAKKDGPINPDGTKMDNLMRALSNLRAGKIVTPKQGVDTGLDVNKKALKVEVNVEGGPLELLVGNDDPDEKAPDGKPLLFASSNKMAGEVFLLPDNLGGVNLREAKSGPAWFRK